MTPEHPSGLPSGLPSGNSDGRSARPDPSQLRSSEGRGHPEGRNTAGRDVVGWVGPDGAQGGLFDGASSTATPTVLIISQSVERRAELSRAIRGEQVICKLTSTPDGATAMVAQEGTAGPAILVAVLDTERCSRDVLKFVRLMGDRGVSVVIVCPQVSFDEAVEAMRAGATDIVSAGVRPKELRRRVRTAMAQSRLIRDVQAVKASGVSLDAGGADLGEVPVVPEQTALPRLTARERETLLGRPAKPGAAGAGAGAGDRHGKLLSRPSGPSRAELSARVIDGIAEDFAVMIRGELDVETLLRQALEFVLAQGGPTNAAVFLPGTTGDYSLGAYVNYTCPKDAAEVLLDCLANEVAPRLDGLEGLAHGSGSREIRRLIGENTPWVEDGELVAFTCREGGETLAIFVLFRDHSAPFGAHLRAVLSKLAPIFAKQLARVVKIHHRHLPKDKWGAIGDPPTHNDESGGLAA